MLESGEERERKKSSFNMTAAVDGGGWRRSGMREGVGLIEDKRGRMEKEGRGEWRWRASDSGNIVLGGNMCPDIWTPPSVIPTQECMWQRVLQNRTPRDTLALCVRHKARLQVLSCNQAGLPFRSFLIRGTEDRLDWRRPTSYYKVGSY